jgi:hypothetical protein
MKNKAKSIQQKLADFPEIMPGKITKQFNVCRSKNCKCKREIDPQKHGPYYYLSFTFKGKGYTLSIPEDRVKEVEERNKNYSEFKMLIEEFIEISIQKTREYISNE